jgi:nucleotide-binding universal stress UspA family protein
MAMDFDIVEATAILKKAKAFLQSQHCHVAQVTYLLGDAVEEICRFSEIQDIDHVVIGSHGRSGLAKLLMGSVGVGVLENCPRPVIVYRYLSRNSDTQRTEVLCSDNMI